MTPTKLALLLAPVIIMTGACLALTGIEHWLAGFARAPDARLIWGGGEMTIGANSNADTTLVVNGPDGEWYCSDDVNGLNPAIRFGEAGQYDIWVGVYEGTNAPATLYVTEY